MSAVVTVTSSTGELFDCQYLKNWLKVDEDITDDDDLITGLLQTALQRYEEYTQRVPLVTTFDYVMDDFPGCGGPVSLPRYPLVSITSVKGYTDTDASDSSGGVAMSSSQFYVDTAHQPGRVVPLGGGVYPTATRTANAAIIRFVAGESSGSSGVSDDVKTTILTMVARGYEHRGDELAQEHAMLEVVGTEQVISQDWG